jgi:AcrR family transcriptional regulator
MAEEETPKRQTRAPGERSRARVVEQAAQLATIEGIEGISIGRLADATGIAKSSVYALFGSKEELQLATINAARDSFIIEVVVPALNATEPGRQRLLALCEGFLSYVERRVFPGGCFFVSASAEVGGRSGRVHDEVARIQQQWRDLLGREASAAVDRGELPANTDPQQLAFELGVILAGTNIVSVLHDDLAVIDRARSAVKSRLCSESGFRTTA